MDAATEGAEEGEVVVAPAPGLLAPPPPSGVRTASRGGGVDGTGVLLPPTAKPPAVPGVRPCDPVRPLVLAAPGVAAPPPGVFAWRP